MLSVLPALSALHVNVTDTNAHVVPAPSTPKALTASIMENVPVDIWQGIFTESVLLENPIQFNEMFGEIWGRPTLGSTGISSHVFVQQPAVISQVCRTWRHIAFGMPEIWSILFIKPRVPAGRETASPPHIIDRLEKLIKFRLSLANPMPLKIYIDARESVQDAKSLIAAILPFSQRWKTIHLNVPSESLSQLLRLTSEDVPMLQSFKFYERVYQMRPWDATQMHDFDLFHIQKIAPSLRRVCTPLQLPANLPSYSTLQELHLQQSPSESQEIYRILSLCMNLQTLSLTGYATTQGVLGETITLPLLTTLNMEHPIGRERLLRAIRTPSLRTLRLLGRGGVHAKSLLLELKNLMMRSDVSSLESLHILYETHNLTDVAIAEFLACNAELKELKIDDTWMFLNTSMITAGLLRDMTLSDVEVGEEVHLDAHDSDGSASCDEERGGRPAGGFMSRPSTSSKAHGTSGSLIPELKRLSLIGCCHFSNQELVTLVHSRMGGRHSLESIYLSLAQTTAPELDQVVREARSRGIEAELLTVRGSYFLVI
ncbi:hypothetical protein CVT24_012056 [Panaeolus cyanescens]|uniref:F-box domain-containing protein n=1 Tax=Panaeolus cyanescens TaxID=181874 RepID=A0A409VHU1_9AGAR|nr:hypothetical protein CVT24_012056 [Panaeolus cyanescens]